MVVAQQGVEIRYQNTRTKGTFPGGVGERIGTSGIASTGGGGGTNDVSDTIDAIESSEDLQLSSSGMFLWHVVDFDPLYGCGDIFCERSQEERAGTSSLDA